MFQIDRLNSQASARTQAKNLADKKRRQARTRTLIQAGGLLNLTGYFAFCGIEEGQDLQLDLETRDKAAVLLGILAQAFEQLPENPAIEQWERWKTIGIRILKMRGSR